MKISSWDVEADWTAIKDGHACLSMGERCWENDYSFVWVNRRFPCFLFDGVIVILDVDGILPIWHPDFDSSDEMLGAFDLYQNAFRDRCGIFPDLLRSFPDLCIFFTFLADFFRDFSGFSRIFTDL